MYKSRSMAKAKEFQCAVVTPEATVFDGRVEFAALPAHDGEIGVLCNRAPLLCKLGVGALRLRGSDNARIWFVDGGFAQVLENQLTVLTPQAIPADTIDTGAADAALREAMALRPRDEVGIKAREHAIERARVQRRLASRS